MGEVCLAITAHRLRPKQIPGVGPRKASLRLIDNLAQLSPLSDKVAFAERAQAYGLAAVPTLAVVEHGQICLDATLPAADLFVKPLAGKRGLEARRWRYEAATDSYTSGDASEPVPRGTFPTTTVFDCDLGRVLAHRRKLRRDNVELLTTSYFLTALAAALEKVPELTADEPVRFGVSLTASDGALRNSVLEVPDTLAESLAERVRAVDITLRANLHTPLGHATLLVHHYGESGSLLATPTPLGAGHVASMGIGRVRRQIVVRVVDGAETPRTATRCYVSLSFLPDRLELHRANLAMAETVRLLETWPE